MAGEFSIYHRLSHSYINSYETKEAAAAEVEKCTKMTEEEKWRRLVNQHRIRFYKDKKELKEKMKEDEEQMLKAWLRSTVNFYRQFPGLFITCEEIPYSLIKKILTENKTGIW